MSAAADLLLPLLLLLTLTSPAFSSSFGINYGQVADNLPPPTSVPPLLHSIGVYRVRLYDADPPVLRAFSGTGVEIVLGIPDKCITKLAHEPDAAQIWVKYNVLPYLPSTKIRAVTIGNEVLTGNDTNAARCLLPAMQAVQAALAALNLDHQIVVTTAHSLAILSTSYPPSSACFRRDLAPTLSQLHQFLAETSAPFLINAYPYFAYKKDPKGVSLDFALFGPSPGLVDSASGLHYDNMLHAQVDAVYAALDALVGPQRACTVPVRVSETGWPSRGDEDEPGATVENAKRYNANLIKLVDQRKGTPRRPNAPLEVYVFALFNENLKPGPLSERNYGLFKPDGTPVYQLFSNSGSGSGTGSSSGSGSGSGSSSGKNVSIGGGDGDNNGFADGGNINSGYYTFSAATKTVEFYLLLPFIAWVVGCWAIGSAVDSAWLF